MFPSIQSVRATNNIRDDAKISPFLLAKIIKKEAIKVITIESKLMVFAFIPDL